MWIRVRGRSFEGRLHLLVPVAAAALALVLRGDIWLRYALAIATLLVHETAHALASLALGGRRVVVSVWPWFGKADVETFTDRREAAVSLAGPGANLLCAAAFWAAGGSFSLALARSPLLDFCLTANLAMGVVNLVPIPPIDGGRALAALLRK